MFLTLKRYFICMHYSMMKIHKDDMKGTSTTSVVMKSLCYFFTKSQKNVHFYIYRVFHMSIWDIWGILGIMRYEDRNTLTIQSLSCDQGVWKHLQFPTKLFPLGCLRICGGGVIVLARLCLLVLSLHYANVWIMQQQTLSPRKWCLLCSWVDWYCTQCVITQATCCHSKLMQENNTGNVTLLV